MTHKGIFGANSQPTIGIGTVRVNIASGSDERDVFFGGSQFEDLVRENDLLRVGQALIGC